MSSLQKDLFKKHQLPPLSSLNEDELPSAIENGVHQQSLSQNSKRFQPADWQSYFDDKRHVVLNGSDSFCVYTRHATTPSETRTPIFIMHHGAGDGGLSFGLTAKHIHAASGGKVGIMAFDCRGHGDTKTTDDTNYRLTRLSQDFIDVVKEVYQPIDQYDFILVGHSMGGSVVVDVAYQKLLPNVLGVVVLDVVEGSALEALQSMQTILSSRPTSFPSVEQAIQWTYKTKMVRNLEACRLSVPPLVTRAGDGDSYIWRTDLQLTQPYWTEWFTDLSKKFLGSPVSKLLLLAGTDRLDKELTIAQMQGKFQLNVVTNAGHFLHEDMPEKTALYLVDFWTRYSKLILPIKT
ncbi:protein phosphatase methylesterase [Hesseltinella vesiculosa]|uniref:Protein phosphatase methylesterase 1 n=1 Tax=Hesseltinella vesiculosa TaxID=101127 RepID=A0A1X2G885_9FUNG|nr:protein phosphatase methylesterase [Hesseltinella vesiculosa]